MSSSEKYIVERDLSISGKMKVGRVQLFSTKEHCWAKKVLNDSLFSLMSVMKEMLERKLQKQPSRGVKGVPKICSRFTEEHPCRSAISMTKFDMGRVGGCLSLDLFFFVG